MLNFPAGGSGSFRKNPDDAPTLQSLDRFLICAFPPPAAAVDPDLTGTYHDPFPQRMVVKFLCREERYPARARNDNPHEIQITAVIGGNNVRARRGQMSSAFYLFEP